MDAVETLRALERATEGDFSAHRRVMSFDSYFTLCDANRVGQTRTSAQYLRDCMLYFGRSELRRPEGRIQRFKLFDCSWDDGKRALSGQESAQQRLFQLLNNFVRDGRVTRLVLLHGPNGSAKSSLIQCLARAAEHYSGVDEGALYRFNWVFPSTKVAKKQLGFGQEDGRGHGESFALLDDADIDAKVPGDLRDHPLLLLPRDSRQRLFEGWSADGFEDEHILGDYLVEGDLSPRSRSIFDALLNAYRGDLRRVLQHVQIERFFLSRRYRRGLVAIEPQMHVDASIRQLTMDQGIQSLPPSLRLLSMYEPGGDLVDANRGFIEYNDLLKKPIDAYKYLLATCEKGTVSLPNAILHLDQVFLASSNELHLAAFKEYPDFTSFKGRMDLVKVPYLRDYTVEVGIYDEQVARDGWEHVSPHATTVLALWAVLTRLRRPVLSHYPTEVREILANLAPLQKATLYAGLGVPHALSPEQERELLALVPELLAEGQDGASYEGSAGASPREMKEVMLNALQNEAYHGLSALAVFEELRDLVKNKSVYEFLNQEVDNGYQDHEGFIDVVFEWWLDRTSLELRDALGLVGARQYEELFARYILHVSYALKGEKIYSEATGRSEEPDTHLMAELESVWKVGSSPERFRRDLVARVGAWRVDNRGEEIAYRELFAHLVQQLEDDYFARQRETIRKVTLEVLQVLGAENETLPYEACSDVDRERVEDVISRLEAIGYPRASIRETLAVLVKHRYA